MKSAEFLVQCVRFRFRTTSRFVRLALWTRRHSAACKVTQVERNTCVLQHHISFSSLQRVHLSASELRGSAVFGQTRRCAASTKLLISSIHWRESCRSKFVFWTVRLDISYRGADKSLARPTSRCILFDGWNISFDDSLVMYINSTNIPPSGPSSRAV